MVTSREGLVSQFVAQEGYVETDSVFAVDRLEGKPAKGLDVVNPVSGERRFITWARNEAAEEEAKRLLGRSAVLPLVEASEDVFQYALPRGARSLAKLLEASPYNRIFMLRLTHEAGVMLDTLRLQSENCIDVQQDDLALVPGTHPDEAARLLVVLPLRVSLEDNPREG